MEMQNNFSFVIMGATGDLAAKKLFPALHRMIAAKRIGDNFCVIAVARRGFTREEFIEKIRAGIKKDDAAFEKLAGHLHYFQLEFNEEAGYSRLLEFLSQTEKRHGFSGNRLFYLATLPSHFKIIAHHLRNGCMAKTHGWCRVVFEKPFGSDEKSAKALNRELAGAFDEKQIYRIDHYLGKGLVQSIDILRAGNRIFSPLWNRENIDHVQINMLEDFGVEGRGEFYDREGALKDVCQSHLLQLLSLVTMEIPKRFDEKCIRDEKVKVLRKVKVSQNDAVLGQYEGYSAEKGVAADSDTETFFALKLGIDNKRWKGVPFYLRSGKGLAKKFASIYIRFKEPNYTVFEGQSLNPNYLVIQIQPADGMLVQLNGKAPGERMKVVPVKMTFCHECMFGPNTPQAYEILLYDAIAGDQRSFIRADEVQHSWKIIDKLTKRRPKVHTYAKGSFGPKEADEMIRKHGREWFNRIENVVQGL